MRKQYSTRVSAKQTVSNKISFVSHLICDEKIEDDIKSKKEEARSLASQSNFARFSLHRGAIDSFSNVHFRLKWSEIQNIPSIILSMQISAIFGLMLFKNKWSLTKNFGEKNHFCFYSKSYLKILMLVTKKHDPLIFEDWKIHQEKE